MECVNPKICSKCGGRCCKKCGCDYFVDDFDVINKETMLNALETGNVSIVSSLDFAHTKNGSLKCIPLLYLRARNINRGVIDLVSLKTQCSMLRENGCFYNEQDRPSGGLNLMPMPNLKCYNIKDNVKEMLKWLHYQQLLSRIVKRYTGISVDEQLKIDVKKVFHDIILENFEFVVKEEIKDMLDCLPFLIKAYPCEFYESLKECSVDQSEVVKKIKKLRNV